MRYLNTDGSFKEYDWMQGWEVIWLKGLFLTKEFIDLINY